MIRAVSLHFTDEEHRVRDSGRARKMQMKTSWESSMQMILVVRVCWPLPSLCQGPKTRQTRGERRATKNPAHRPHRMSSDRAAYYAKRSSSNGSEWGQVVPVQSQRRETSERRSLLRRKRGAKIMDQHTTP